jgi:predicted hydrocarbon binding protein
MKKTLVKLLARFIGHKCITFDGSRIYYWKVPMMIIPMEVLAMLQHDLEKEFGSHVRKIFYYLGKIQGRNGSNILIERFSIIPDESDLSFFMEQSEFVGIGKMNLEKNEVSQGYMLINNVNSTNAKAYLDVFGKRDKPICDYVRGLISGAVEAIFQAASKSEETLDGVEIECHAKGDPECKIEVKRTSLWMESEFKDELLADLSDLNEVKNKQTLSMLMRSPAKNIEKGETQLSISLKNKFKGNHIEYKEGGIVSLLGMNCLITPIDMTLWLYQILFKKYGGKVNEIFYNTGINFGKKSSEFLFKEFNLKSNNIQHIKMAFELPGLFGLGHVNVLKLDINNHNFLIRVSNSPATQYKELFGLSKIKMDYFLAGIFSGILESIFNIKFNVIEDVCAVSGAKYCMFKANKK